MDNGCIDFYFCFLGETPASGAVNYKEFKLTLFSLNH